MKCSYKSPAISIKAMDESRKITHQSKKHVQKQERWTKSWWGLPAEADETEVDEYKERCI